MSVLPRDTGDIGGVPWAIEAMGMARPLVILVLTLFIAGSVTWLQHSAAPIEAEYLVFGTRVRLVLRDTNQDDTAAAFSEIGRLLARDHRTWHPWEPSELTRLNDALAHGQSRRVPPDLADMIRRAQQGFVQSDGLFNAAAGRVIASWGFHTSQYPVQAAVPSPEQLQALVASRTAMNDVQVDDDGGVRTTNSTVSLDLNGLAEGYAAAQVRQLLQRHHVRYALIYIGGFVLAMGDNVGHAWHVGIGTGQGVLGTVELRDGEALSSSGDYQRHLVAAPDQGHIIDIREGRPQRASVAASVISRDPVLADMASTAMMVAGPSGFQHLAERMKLGCALLLGHDRVLYATPGMLARLRLSAGSAPARVMPLPTQDCDTPSEQAPAVVMPAELMTL